MKKLITLLLSLSLVLSAAACTTGGGDGTQAAGGEGGESGGEAKDTVVYAFPNDAEGFGPMKTPKSGYSELTFQVYDCLFTYDSEGNFIPQVCTEVEQVDGTHYLLHLRDDVTFSDGHKLVAEDVVYTLSMYSADANSNTWVKYVDVEATNAVDDTTVELVLTEEYAFAISTLMNVNLFYQEAYEASEDGMASEPIGSGPYVLKEYVSGSYALFEGRDDYWGGAPAIKNLRIMFIKEASQRTTALQTGEVDCAYDVLSSDYETLLADGFEGKELFGDKSFNLMFNCSENSICADPRVRQAIAYATDNEGILAAAFGGFGEICTTCSSNGMVDIGDMYHPEDYYHYNLDTAKQLLQEAGVAEGTSVNIMIRSGDASQTTSAEIIQQSLQSIGMNAEIMQVEAAVYDDTQKDHTAGWDVSLNDMNTAGSMSALDLVNLYCYIIPNLGYTNEEDAALSAQAVSSTDEQFISDATYQLSQTVCEDVPYYAILTKSTLLVWNSSLNEVSPARGSSSIRGTGFSWKE